MRTGYIKFCGGCNATYDRAAAARYIREHIPGDIELFDHEPGVARDIGILLLGCPRECVDTAKLAPCKRLFIATGDKEARAIARQLSLTE